MLPVESSREIVLQLCDKYTVVSISIYKNLELKNSSIMRNDELKDLMF